MKKTAYPNDKYTYAQTERKKHVHAVLISPAKNKIVVAGPGTGKTCLFKKVLEGKTNCLTLTFVNALVEDLSLELCGLSNVRTLHSFAYTILNRPSKKIKIFPKLPNVIKKDAKIILNNDIDFDYLFNNKMDNNVHIAFYKKRKDYYGKYYGYSDIIFALVKYFEQYRNKIPQYDHILVDEFQDFNLLEVSLIDLLSEKSPILLVGDDDQALYDFKSASTQYIRERYSDNNLDYASFNLPHCSRSTRVIVETANDIINMALKKGFLKHRINKPYYYFDDKKKDKESARYPKIAYFNVYARQIPWVINKNITNIAEEIKGEFSVLIISPTRVQSRDIVKALRIKGYQQIVFVEKRHSEEPTLMDGLKILLDNKKSNLGWRIISEFLFTEKKDFYSLIKKTHIEGAEDISDIMHKSYKHEVAEMIKILRAIKNNEAVDEVDLYKFLPKVGHDPIGIARNYLKNEIQDSSQKHANPGIRKISLKATTIQGSKGLAADYVFITHFENQYFLGKNNEISDQNICNFLVALTRARTKVFLISSNPEEDPTFLSWINGKRIDREN